jgi:hypothetical protein
MKRIAFLLLFSSLLFWPLSQTMTRTMFTTKT